MRFADVPFTGSTAALPVIYDAYQIAIGVYAGDIRTTTPAVVPCARSITDGKPLHPDPPPDIYEQLLEAITHLAPKDGIEVGSTLSMISGVNAKLVGDAAYVPANRWNCWQETNDDGKETATVVAKPSGDCILLACAMHRGDSAYPSISIEGDGWSKVVDSVPMTLSGGQTQQIAVWSKRVTKGSYAVTVSHAASRMSLKVIALYEAQNFLNVVANELIGANPYTPPSTTGKRRLYLLSAFYATGSTVVHTAQNTGNLDLRSATETRFSVFYDYQPELETTPSFLCSPWDSDMNNCITLDIYDEEAT